MPRCLCCSEGMTGFDDDASPGRPRRVPRCELRLLHASDCHLGLSTQMTSNEEAFAALIDLAVSQNVDAIVVAGDMFDSPRVGPSILDWTARQLDRVQCPVVILPGNHDIYGDRSAFASLDFEQRCRDVHVLDQPGGELICLPDLDVAFFGRAVHDHDPSFRPVADVPPRPDMGWCVVIGHGLLLDDDRPTERGSPIYPSDLARIDWDYVALGHLPTFKHVQSVRVPVVYSGNTARSRDGRPGAVLVEMDPERGVTPTWTPLDALPGDPTTGDRSYAAAQVTVRASAGAPTPQETMRSG
jgi:DNA repair exonuclease SbcCD nuclease subunit